MRTAVVRPRALTAAITVACLMAAALPTWAAVTQMSDTLSVVKGSDALSNAEVAVALSQGTFEQQARTVIVSRDDRFADALASGVLQDDGPLLLVPPTGPLPQSMAAEVQRLQPERVVILGGVAAVSAEVESELAAMGLPVQRRAGASRLETATAVAAAEAPTATTAIMARAFGSQGDETQAFADSIAAGGLAAAQDWPVLLSDSDRLSEPTRSYLASSQITTVKIVGGTAALSAQVEADLRAMDLSVERISGDTRFATAVEIAKEVEEATGDPATGITLVEGVTADAWAGGLASAARVAQEDAPIVLATGGSATFAQGGALPEPTRAYIAEVAGRRPADATAPVLSCVSVPGACEEARQTLGLPPAATVTSDPPEGTPVHPGQPVTITVDGASGGVTVTGTCLDGPSSGDASTVTVMIGSAPPSPACTLTASLTLADGATTQSTTLSFAVGGPPPPGGDEGLLVAGSCSWFSPTLSHDGRTAVYAASPGCPGSSGGDMDAVFVDVATGALTTRPMPGTVSNPFAFHTSTSPDGAVAALLVLVEDPTVGSRLETAIARRDEPTVSLVGDLIGVGEAFVTSPQSLGGTQPRLLFDRLCQSGEEGCAEESRSLDLATGQLNASGDLCTAFRASQQDPADCNSTMVIDPSGAVAVMGGVVFPGDGSGTRHHIVGVDIATGATTTTQLPAGPYGSCDPTGASEGGRVVVATCDNTEDGTADAVVVDTAAGTTTPLPGQAADGLTGRIDATGRWVPFLTFDGTSATAGVVDLQTGLVQALPEALGVPAVSSAGRVVLYQASDGLRTVPLAGA